MNKKIRHGKATESKGLKVNIERAKIISVAQKKDLYLDLANILAVCARTEYVETQCIVVSANTVYTEDAAILKEG